MISAVPASSKGQALLNNELRCPLLTRICCSSYIRFDACTLTQKEPKAYRQQVLANTGSRQVYRKVQEIPNEEILGSTFLLFLHAALL